MQRKTCIIMSKFFLAQYASAEANCWTSILNLTQPKKNCISRNPHFTPTCFLCETIFDNKMHLDIYGFYSLFCGSVEQQCTSGCNSRVPVKSMTQLRYACMEKGRSALIGFNSDFILVYRQEKVCRIQVIPCL